ncbi:hypothetical protein KUTeg_004161 [Tegillarca granosa]|uniref:Protein zer-1 homolog-like C-terminal domain-containing protein n=1 Tax=Tegillarca granosa TaxID=220873 RepID=A0ABQ9FP88_TEGGR|nr:hypothetical protein KUTeg_004161 [Tegillarca granosa]
MSSKLKRYTESWMVVKCCMLCFLCLDLPDIAVTCHIFKWYVACLIEALWNFEGDFYERIGLRLLHETCRADYKEKDIVGEQGAISLLLQIIERKLDANICDENMERAWSCLWNEMPLNCERFLKENGMNHYMNCIRIFNEEAGLLRKLTGLMANLSEVNYLRPELMTEELMSIFRGFLDSQLDDKSVSYHAASIMSEFAADGEAAWTVESPTRDEIQDQIIETVKSWDLNEAKKIKYRSLNPMLRLVQEYSTPAAQYWAIWALCNLCKVKEESYCPMLEMEGGVQILQSVLKDSRPTRDKLTKLQGGVGLGFGVFSMNQSFTRYFEMKFKIYTALLRSCTHHYRFSTSSGGKHLPNSCWSTHNTLELSNKVLQTHIKLSDVLGFGSFKTISKLVHVHKALILFVVAQNQDANRTNLLFRSVLAT